MILEKHFYIMEKKNNKCNKKPKNGEQYSLKLGWWGVFVGDVMFWEVWGRVDLSRRNFRFFRIIRDSSDIFPFCIDQTSDKSKLKKSWHNLWTLPPCFTEIIKKNPIRKNNCRFRDWEWGH